MKIKMTPIKNEILLFILTDTLALGAGWLAYDEISQAYHAIEMKMAEFSFLSNMPFALIGLFFPLLTILCIIYHLKPDFFKMGVLKSLDFGGVMVFLFGLVLVACFILKIYVLYDIERSGYYYCAKRSHFMTFSKKLVFVKDSGDCK